MTCEDNCLCYEVCKNAGHPLLFEYEGAKKCPCFKDKSKFIDISNNLYLVECDYDSMYGDAYWLRCIPANSTRLFTDKSKAEAKLKELNENET